LARRGKGALHQARDRLVQPGVAVNVHARVGTQFQHQLLEAGRPGNLLAHAGTAGEGDEVDPRVLHQLSGDIGPAVDDADGPRRQAGLEQDFPEHQPSERRLWGGFHDDRVAGGNGWARLVADEVERGGDGRDAGYDAHRLAYDKPHPVLRAGHPVEPHFLSSKAAGFLSTYGQGEDRAVDLLPAVADRLARLPGDRGRELLLALRDEARRLKQD